MSGVATWNGVGSFDAHSTGSARPRRAARAWGARAAFALAAAAAIVGAAVLASAPRRSAIPAVANAVAPTANEVVDAALPPLFGLEGEDAAQARHEARVDRATAARSDAFSLGALDGDKPALRIEMWKRANAAAESLFVEIAEQAAAAGAAIERWGASQIATTSRGPVEWAEATLRAKGGARSCVGFRLLGRTDGGLRGFVCAASGRRIGAGAARCLVERVAVTRAGREAGFAEMAKGPAMRRAACRAAIG